jgi:hypothetical protein
MFEWLERELAAIHTPRFHVVDGPADARLREAVVQSSLPLPSSYKEFVLRFGNARFYRRVRSDSYQIGVFAGPREATLRDGTRIYTIGFHDGATVYVKDGYESTEVPIFEFESSSENEAANGFDEWLIESCTRARSRYTKEEWAAILRGPEPFTTDEEKVIDARRRIQWRMLGIDANGDHTFEVKNAACHPLAELTVGVRSGDRRLNGSIVLNIAHIGADQTGLVRAACYKGLISPGELEVFALPDPQPEDRERYAELAAAKPGKRHKVEKTGGETGHSSGKRDPKRGRS